MAIPRNYRTYAAQIAFVKALIDYLSDQAGGPSPAALRLGITIEQITALRLLLVAAEAVASEYNNLDKKTAGVVRQMKEVAKAMWDDFLALRKIVIAAVVEKTPFDREMFAIPTPGPRIPSEIPTAVPLPVVVKRLRGSLVAEAMGQETDTVNKVAVPTNTEIVWEVFIGDGPPTDKDFELAAITGRNRHTFVFTAEQRGMTVWFRAAYQTRKGTGPWSRHIKEVIS